MEMNHYNSWNFGIFQLVDVVFPTLDVYSDDLFDASIKLDIVFDVKRIAKEWNKKSKIKYLNRYIVFNGNGVMFHGMMNGLSSLFVEKTKYKRMLQ